MRLTPSRPTHRRRIPSFFARRNPWNGHPGVGKGDGTNPTTCSGKASGARHANIGLDKVLTLEQQWFVHRFRQGVSETIAEIQPGPMPASPEVVVCLARQSALLQGHGFNDDGSGTQERLCLPGGIRPGLPFEDNGEFQMVHDTEAADVRRQDQACEVLCLGLFE